MIVFPIQVNKILVVANATNANPIVITTAAHGMSTGETVTIKGVTDNTNANVSNHPVTVVSATTFSLDGIAGNADYIGGGGRVFTNGAPSRSFPAVTALTGDVHTLTADVLQAAKFNLYVATLNDPTSPGDEVDIKVFGSPSADAGYFEISTITEVTAGWTTAAPFMNEVVDLQVHPRLRMDVVVSAASTNTVQAWIAI